MNHWIAAARPRTLPLALASIIMGSFLAARSGQFVWSVAGLSVLTTVLLQILSNFANDYGDAVNGKDTELRQGPSRAVQKGVITAQQMRNAMIVFSCLSLFSGLALLFIALREAPVRTFWGFLGLGLLCILAAITYTAGKKPYGYAGLGDLSVFIFFGWVGVIGSNYLYTLQWEWLYLLPAASCGLFAVAVLNINNIRDIASDKATGKNSIPVRIGRENAVKYHWSILTVGMLCAILYAGFSGATFWNYLFLLSFPLIIINGLAVTKIHSPMELDPYLKQMAVSTLLFVLLFGIGFLM
jgi:1,4-dihydroxy-2-naphthoate octaprenyltransferase